MPGLTKLLFVDTNIWLDFYRPAKSDAILKLLKHIESVGDRIITTHQLEMEFKKNRQAVILDSLKALSAPSAIPTQGLFSDAKAKRAIEANIKQIGRRVTGLKRRLTKVLADPVHHDPVYQTCQRLFTRESDLALGLEDKRRVSIRRKAIRRFYLGCPPRKSSETSIGDAYNWEWMVECAIQHRAELVLLSRDSDYGCFLDGKCYLNDHLRQEFSERVSKKRKVYLCRSIADALNLLGVKVSKEEAEEDLQLAKPRSRDMYIESKGDALFWARVKRFFSAENQAIAGAATAVEGIPDPPPWDTVKGQEDDGTSGSNQQQKVRDER